MTNLAQLREWAEEAQQGGYSHVSMIDPSTALALIDQAQRMEAALEKIGVKIQASGYHRNFRAACLDIDKILVDLSLWLPSQAENRAPDEVGETQ